jgi:hypothetical protein
MDSMGPPPIHCRLSRPGFSRKWRWVLPISGAHLAVDEMPVTLVGVLYVSAQWEPSLRGQPFYNLSKPWVASGCIFSFLYTDSVQILSGELTHYLGRTFTAPVRPYHRIPWFFPNYLLGFIAFRIRQFTHVSSSSESRLLVCAPTHYRNMAQILPGYPSYSCGKRRSSDVGVRDF